MIDEEIEYFTDFQFPPDCLAKWLLNLNLVPIATTLAVFRYITSLGQISDNSKGRPLRDSQTLRDIAKTHSGIMGNANEGSAVIREKAPSRHAYMSTIFSGY